MVSNVMSVLIQIIVSPYDLCHFSLTVLKNFSLSLGFNKWVMICLGIVFFALILFGVHWAFWVYKYTSFTKFGKLSALSLQTLFLHQSGCSGTVVILILDLLTFPHSLIASWDSFFFFLIIASVLQTIFIDLSSRTVYSVIPILMLSPSSEFLTSITLFF